MVNPLGTKGNVAHAFADILHEMWQGELPYLSPYTFRVSYKQTFYRHSCSFYYLAVHNSTRFSICWVRTTRLPGVSQFLVGRPP